MLHHRAVKHVCFVVIIISFGIASLIYSIPISASEDVKIFPPDSNPYGLTYGEWSAKWWQWVLSLPTDKNPLLDKTGELCNESQEDKDVFFLVGTFGGKVERTCTIPSGKAILFPVVAIEADFINTPEARTEDSLMKLVKEDQDSVTLASAKVNDSELTRTNNFRFQSPLFNLSYPSNNVYGVPPGQTIAVSEGTWIMMEPLPPGEYTLNFKGVILDYSTTGPENFVTDVTYHIRIVPS